MRARRPQLWFAWLLAVVIGSALVGAPTSVAQQATGRTLPVEQKYSKPGPWTVETLTNIPCNGYRCDVFHPRGLGRDGGHPLITWANGTQPEYAVPQLPHPSKYAYLLRHFASWGFVVVAVRDGSTVSGRSVLAAARWMRDRNADSGSRFFGRVDTQNVAAVGHSQGAAGAINALLASDGFIKTVIPIELPAQTLCPDLRSCVTTRDLSAGDSIFLVNGSASLISPSTQTLPPELVGLRSNRAYYEATPNEVAKAWATLKGAKHNDIQGHPGCQGIIGCANGVTGFLGYLTAWLADRLLGDELAHRAFVTDDGELFRSNDWTNQHSNIPEFEGTRP